MILKKKNRYFILAVIVANTGIMFWTYHDQQKFELSICQAQKKKILKSQCTWRPCIANLL